LYVTGQHVFDPFENLLGIEFRIVLLLPILANVDAHAVADLGVFVRKHRFVRGVERDQA